jgi:two-component system NarL family response regulator
MTTASRIGILIVEDHLVARFGLRTLLEQQKDMQVVGEAKHGGEALVRFRETRPDLVVMDLRMPEGSGIQAITAIRREAPDAHILVLSSYDTDDEIRGALHAGATGYIMKEAEAEELLHAIHVVHEGGRYLPPRLAAQLAVAQEAAGLSARHREILWMMSKGLSNREIARLTSLTAGSVRIYVSRILTKLGAANRAEAVATALERGILRKE